MRFSIEIDLPTDGATWGAVTAILAGLLVDGNRLGEPLTSGAMHPLSFVPSRMGRPLGVDTSGIPAGIVGSVHVDDPGPTGAVVETYSPGSPYDGLPQRVVHLGTIESSNGFAQDANVDHGTVCWYSVPVDRP
jgi:hypothetical protein